MLDYALRAGAGAQVAGTVLELALYAGAAAYPLPPFSTRLVAQAPTHLAVPQSRWGLTPAP